MVAVADRFAAAAGAVVSRCYAWLRKTITTLRRERLLLAGQDDNYVAPRRLVRLATLLEKLTAFGLSALGFGPGLLGMSIKTLPIIKIPTKKS